MTPSEIEAHFHPVLRATAQRTLELLEPTYLKVQARPGVAAIDQDGEFSQHWSSSLRELCEIVYGDARTEVRRVLEIGAYEGRSTAFLATFFINALVDTIDGQPPAPAFEMPTAWTEALADMLAERDPFTALQVDSPCPDCGHVNPAEVDLEALLLADFAACQRRLLEEVTLLARNFHWSEAQILDLPAWRRAHYIARLDAMGAA